MVPYPRAYEVYGTEFLLQPTNFLSFTITVFGLLTLALTALKTALPAIKKQPQKINVTYIGIIMVAFGSYFLFNTLYYYLTGSYQAHPSVWYEVIGPLHNPNLWALAFIFVGVPLIIQSKLKQRKTNTPQPH
jgi:DMSO/TMAO reductase YedYZ heme-binding membrane subunit